MTDSVAVCLRVCLACLLGCACLAACEQYGVPKDTSGSFASCCNGLGTCVARGLVDAEQLGSVDRGSCRTDLVCIPNELVKAGAGRLHACSVELTGAEGRCVPACLPEVGEQPGLRRDDCASGQLCAPCYDPLTGRDTGVCQLGTDPGPERPAVLFDACCGALGRCVPSTLIGASDRERLSGDACRAQMLCVPTQLASSDTWKPSVCSDEATGAEGRCLPACLPDVARRKSKLTRGACAAEHLCAPCYDPVTQQETGACGLGADTGPEQPARVFARCCAGLGRCVPISLVEPDDREQLVQDSCELSNELCVPEALAQDDRAQLESCVVADTQAEGRCIPACLPELAARSSQLQRDSCARAGELCAPCYDPVDGRRTAACSLGGDPGPTLPAATFSTCCGSVGRCVPQARVPERERTRLSRDSCTRDGELCVPAPLAQDADYAFASCSVRATGGEGRCLPACLPEVASRASQLRADGCGSDALCTPCYEPVDGAQTSACTLGGDTGPSQPPALFDACCEQSGRCVPAALIASRDAARLERDSCASAEDRCVPAELARDSAFVFATCYDTNTGAEGRCLLACLPEVAAQAAQLTRSGCTSQELCAPCYDPLDAVATGACALAGDPGPTATAYTYPHCCNDAGRCVPRALVPDAQLAHLNADGCSAADAALCVPLTLTREPDAVAASCHDAATGAEGRCLMRCLPELQARADQLSQGSCATDELCAPCYDPITGDSTDACSLSSRDAPREPPVIFGDCCGGDGRCVPSSLVSSGDFQILSAQECTQSGWVCAPRVMVEGPSSRLSSCVSVLGPSACLNGCFVPPALGDLLPADACTDPDRCVPCYVAAGLCQ